MIQLQHLIGLPVLRENGKKAGKACDLWFDENWTLVGVVMESRGWFGRNFKVVYWENIVACGHDALLIRNDALIESVNRKKLLRTFHTGVTRLKDMPVYTREGQHLGEVADVYFQASAGTQIIGYELTDGFLVDLFEGRRRLILPEFSENVTLGEDALLVPASCERALTRDPTWKATGEDG
jgi:uncharacterized protein YrrD